MQKIIMIVVVAAALAFVGWVLFRNGAESPEIPEPVPEAPEAPSAQPPAEPEAQIDPTPLDAPEAAEVEPSVPLPPLPQSDPFVRERLEPMDLPDEWVAQEDYVRRLAVLVENAARGDYPRRQLAFLAPSGRFQVVERNERLYVDPASYDRYDDYVDELVSVDSAQLAGLLETLEPLVETALAEIGVEAPPGEVFSAALNEVLSVPVLESDVELVQPNVMYEFANPELEALSPLKKQVLRMGPENVRRLQAYLRDVGAAMDLEVPPA